MSRWTPSFRSPRTNNLTSRSRWNRRHVFLGLESLEERTVPSNVGLLSAAASSSSTTASGQSELAPMHSISDNGRFTVYGSTATNLVSSQSASATTKTENIFLYDNQSGSTTLITHIAGLTSADLYDGQQGLL
jgi:hypothetical protein